MVEGDKQEPSLSQDITRVCSVLSPPFFLLQSCFMILGRLPTNPWQRRLNQFGCVVLTGRAPTTPRRPTVWIGQGEMCSVPEVPFVAGTGLQLLLSQKSTDPF